MYAITTYSPAEYLRKQGYLIDGAGAGLPRRGRAFITDIQTAVCQHFNLDRRYMTSANRAREYARPRQVGMWLCREFTKASLPEIGRRFGGRDHTTVMHAIRQIEKFRVEDPEIRQAISVLSTMIATHAREAAW